MPLTNGGQKDLAPLGVLREKESKPQDRDLFPDRMPKDAPTDLKTSSRSLLSPAIITTSSGTGTTSSMASLPSSRPLAKEDKENKIKGRGLPAPRVTSVRPEDIPQFYFPLGKPQAAMDVDAVILKATTEFSKLDGGKAYKEQMGQIAKV